MTDTRATLDTMIQGSAVDLFHSFGLAVAPVECTRFRSDDIDIPKLGSVIRFEAPRFTGTLTVIVSPAVFSLIQQDPEHRYSGHDWVCEVSNQLLGRIKVRLLRRGITLQADLPVAAGPDVLKDLKRVDGLLAAYTFKTLRGEILIVVGGEIDHRVLAYTGAHHVPKEGDVILF